MKLKHTSFVCSSADQIAAFYSLLGFVVEKDLVRPEEGLRRLVLAGGGGRLQFFEAAGQPASRSSSWMEHIALELEDFDLLIEGLRSSGVVFGREPGLSPSGRRMAFVLDPDGRQLELLELLEAQD